MNNPIQYPTFTTKYAQPAQPESVQPPAQTELTPPPALDMNPWAGVQQQQAPAQQQQQDPMAAYKNFLGQQEPQPSPSPWRSEGK